MTLEEAQKKVDCWKMTVRFYSGANLALRQRAARGLHLAMEDLVAVQEEALRPAYDEQDARAREEIDRLPRLARTFTGEREI